MKKKFLVLYLMGAISLGNSFASFAAWEQTGGIWKYKDDTTGAYLTNGWHWLDGNKDGVAECYYFDADGIMAANGKTADGYDVNSDGAWTENGVVQTKEVTTGNSQFTGNSTGTETQSKSEETQKKAVIWALLPENYHQKVYQAVQA